MCRPEIVAGLAFGSASGFLTTVARPLLLQALILAQEEGAAEGPKGGLQRGLQGAGKGNWGKNAPLSQ